MLATCATAAFHRLILWVEPQSLVSRIVVVVVVVADDMETDGGDCELIAQRAC